MVQFKIQFIFIFLYSKELKENVSLLENEVSKVMKSK